MASIPSIQAVGDGIAAISPDLREGDISYQILLPRNFSPTSLASNKDDITGSLYKTRIGGSGLRRVYAVEALCKSGDKDTRAVKLAIKRFSPAYSAEQFMKEYNALRQMNRHYHPNLVQLLAAFRVPTNPEWKNLAFPLAAGSLKQLLWGDESLPLGISQHRQHLWTQLEGLASALAYLHHDCDMSHKNVESSNILLYEQQAVPNIVAKLADFRLATDYTRTAESRDFRIEEDKRVDVLDLGFVFMELLSLLVVGTQGVKQFRDYIKRTTVIRYFNSMGVDSTTKGVTDDVTNTPSDDIEMVKPQVLEWLKQLGDKDSRVHELIPLLRSMLGATSLRSSATDVSKALQQSSIWSYSDGVRLVSFIEHKSTDNLTTLNRGKAAIENWLKMPVDWWPLRPPRRLCPKGHVRINWEWCGRSLHTDVPSADAHEYRSTSRPILELAGNPGSSELPVHHSMPELTDMTEAPSISPTTNAMIDQIGPGSGSGNDLKKSPMGASLSTGVCNELYWCVDESWTRPLKTQLCHINTMDFVRNDSELCEILATEYERIRGWKGKLLSWKRCMGIEFIQFRVVFDQKKQIVPIRHGLPTPEPGIWDYALMKSEKIHMQIAATQLLSGMHEAISFPCSDTIDLIPKKCDQPLLLKKGSVAWGVYARQGFSFRRFLLWCSCLLTSSLILAALWLAYISATDLENAFIPFVVLATLITLGSAAL